MVRSATEFQVPSGAMDAPGFEERSAELAVEAPFLRPRILEGIGAARYEAATGRWLARPTPSDPSHDFHDAELGVRIDLKGPLPPRGGPVPDDRVDGLIEAIVREANLSTGCDMVVVDLLGLDEAQRGRVRAAVEARARSDKTIAFLGEVAMGHTIIGDERLHARFHIDALRLLLVTMREGGLLAPVAEPLAARWLSALEAYEEEGYVNLANDVLHDDAAREALRGAAHAAAARLARPGADLPPTVRETSGDADALRLTMLAQARELADYLDRRHALAELRAPAA